VLSPSSYDSIPTPNDSEIRIKIRATTVVGRLESPRAGISSSRAWGRIPSHLDDRRWTIDDGRFANADSPHRSLEELIVWNKANADKATIMGRRYSEPNLIGFAYAVEQATKARKAPQYKPTFFP
jgi:hypothetical protein